MVPAVRPLGPLSMARGCARIDSRPDTAKIGSADRVEVHHARLLAVIGVRKTFPHGLDPHRTSTTKVGNRHTCGSPELWGDSGSYELGGIARFRFRLNTHMPSVVATQEALMSIKRILVPLPGSASHTGQIETALSAAKALGAHVQALFISQPPPDTRSDVTRGGLNVTEMGRTVTAASVNWYAEERERNTRDAREVFAQACAVVGIPMRSANDEPDSPLAASWREAEGSYVEIAVQRAAAFDLMVAASATMMESLMAIAEQSLLQTRRPVLLAPARPQSDLTDSVMIAWDESPECWHAVSAAIPFM